MEGLNVNYKKVITAMTLGVFVISSSGGIVAADTSDLGEINDINYFEITMLKDFTNIINPYNSYEISSPNGSQQEFVDVESPKVNFEVGTTISQINNRIDIPFTQPLHTTNQELYAHDLVIKQIAKTNIPFLNPMIDYTTRVEGNKIIVTFLVD